MTLTKLPCGCKSLYVEFTKTTLNDKKHWVLTAGGLHHCEDITHCPHCGKCLTKGSKHK